MKKDFLKVMICTKCKSHLEKNGAYLVCKKGHKFEIKGSIPVMVKIDHDLGEEAKAWEDWQMGVSKQALGAYKKNMAIFRKLGFWEEAAEAYKNIPSKESWTVLDLGCGNGVSTNYLKGKTVVGVDLSEKEMVRAKKNFPNINYLVADATKLPFKTGSFDLIVAVNLLHHLADKTDKGLKECYRILKKGGILLTVDPNLTNPIGFTTRELFKLLKLKKSAPTFPQFALQNDEYQFNKKMYNDLFEKSPFKKFIIKGHRIERITFFLSILIPKITDLSFYESLVIFTSKVGNSIVGSSKFDRLCYFWKAEAVK